MLLGRLGSGGMGRVYLARSPGGRMVAVKVIRANLAEDAGFRARFAREVSAARKVGGLFTAQVVDADIDGPVPWLVTAYVPGTSLSDAVERQGPLPDASVLALAAGLAEGLIAIHAAGVIHRDLKPSNVLLAQDGPRIIDFGISSAAEATALTGTGFMIGSPGFMSPEQAEGLVVGPASDIFSLAGVLIYAARGEGPFGSGDTAALLYRVVHGKPTMDKVPENLRPLIKRSLSRDPTRRPSATQFLADLSAAYPSAAVLSDWLPARLLDPSAAGAAPADVTGYPPAASGGSAVGGLWPAVPWLAVLWPAVLWPGGSVAGGSVADQFGPGDGGPGSVGGDAMAPARRPRLWERRPSAGSNTPLDPPIRTTQSRRPRHRPRRRSPDLRPPREPRAAGAFGAGQLSGSARLPGTTRVSGTAGTRGAAGLSWLAWILRPARPFGSAGILESAGVSGAAGVFGTAAISRAAGVPDGPGRSGRSRRFGVPGRSPQGQRPQGSSWWSGQPGGMPQAPVPAQGMPGGPGMPGADQWYQPPAGPGRPRKRPRWLSPPERPRPSW